MRRTREFVALPILAALVAVAWFVVHVRGEGERGHARVALEDQAVHAVEALAAAQGRLLEAEKRYGWLAELRAAGGLPGLTYREIEGALTVSTPGYRIDVLLPATTSAGAAVALAPRSQARLSDRLARRHFAVVARPWGQAPGGWRTYYLDERGRMFVNEGVSDPTTRSRPPLPPIRVAENGGTGPGGHRWWPLDDLPPR